jgi:hypothetical protein
MAALNALNAISKPGSAYWISPNKMSVSLVEQTHGAASCAAAFLVAAPNLKAEGPGQPSEPFQPGTLSPQRSPSGGATLGLGLCSTTIDKVRARAKMAAAAALAALDFVPARRSAVDAVLVGTALVDHVLTSAGYVGRRRMAKRSQ